MSCFEIERIVAKYMHVEKGKRRGRIIVDFDTLKLSLDEDRDFRINPLGPTEIDVWERAKEKHKGFSFDDLTAPLLKALAMEAVCDSVDSRYISDHLAPML